MVRCGHLAMWLLALGVPLEISALKVVTQRVVAGGELNRPVFVTAAPGDRGRVFIVDAWVAEIRILALSDDSLLDEPFLSLSGQVSLGGEQGLLGLAFHPDYAQNGSFYVAYTDVDGDLRLVRYHVSDDPDVADPESGLLMLSISQPGPQHNGGGIVFGPDGLLYVASGDGGGSNDDEIGHTPETGNAQDITDNLLGKILRLDVDGDDFPEDPDRNYRIPPSNPFVGMDGDDEIWAYGLRNPWRVSFDRETGDFYIADVGQITREELNVQPAASAGGENYGWRLREGMIETPTPGGAPVGGPRPPGNVDPIFDYPHAGPGISGCAITGGYVYRGPVAALRGHYFFSDFCAPALRSLRFDGSESAAFDGTNYTDLTNWSASGEPGFVPDAGTLAAITSFGEDDEGNLYVVSLGGDVFRIPEPGAALVQLASLACLALLARSPRCRVRVSVSNAPYVRRHAGASP